MNQVTNQPTELPMATTKTAIKPGTPAEMLENIRDMRVYAQNNAATGGDMVTLWKATTFERLFHVPTGTAAYGPRFRTAGVGVLTCCVPCVQHWGTAEPPAKPRRPRVGLLVHRRGPRGSYTPPRSPSIAQHRDDRHICGYAHA